MEPALEPPPAEAQAPVFPAMRGMAPAHSPAPEIHYAPMRGMAPPATAEAVAHTPAFVRQADADSHAGANFAAGRKPPVATALSFFIPGGGQFYNGDIKKAVAVFALAVLASCLTIYAGVWFLGVPLSLGTWVWSMLDAGKVARGQKAIW